MNFVILSLVPRCVAMTKHSTFLRYFIFSVLTIYPRKAKFRYVFGNCMDGLFVCYMCIEGTKYAYSSVTSKEKVFFLLQIKYGAN